MKINDTMKTKTLLIAVLTLAILTPVAANAAPTVNEVQVSPDTITEGESVSVSLNADSHNEADIVSAQARLSDQRWSEAKEKSCENPYSCDEVSFSFSPSQGTHTVDVRVLDSSGSFSNIESETFTVESPGVNLDLKNVKSTRFRFSEGQEGQLQADVENNRQYTSEVTVKWYAERNGRETRIASRTQWVSAGSTETLTRMVSWYQLQTVLDKQKPYDLKAKLFYSGDQIDEETSDIADLYLESDTSQDVSIVDYSATKKGDGKVRFYVKLDRDVSGYSCRVSKNDQITTFDSPVMNKVSGSDRKFEVTSTFSEGSHTRYLGCLDSNNEQVTGAKRVSFTIEEDVNRRIEWVNIPSTPRVGSTYNIKAKAYAEADQLHDREFKLHYNVMNDGEGWRSIDSDWCSTFSSSCTVDGDFTPQSGVKTKIRAKIQLKDGDVLEKIRTVDPEGTSNGGDDDDDNDVLDAEFTVSDSTPEVGQEIEFDASGSTGDIEEYKWFFGDGQTEKGRVADHSYSQEGTYTAHLRIKEDGEDNYAHARKEITVHQSDAACRVSISELRLNPDEIFRGESSKASLVINNLGNEDQTAEVKIYSDDEGTFRQTTVDLDSGESRRVSADVTSDNDEIIRYRVETGGSNCGTEVFRDAKELVVFQRADNGDEDSYLDVHVEDDDGDDIENAVVRAENGETKTRETDEDGDASFTLEAGDYEVRVSKAGYVTEEKDIELESGESRSLSFSLEKSDMDEDEGQLVVLTKDEYGDELEDARVRVENGDTDTEYTDDNGRADFFLEEGEYDVTVSKSGYETESREVEIEENEKSVEVFRLSRGDEDDGGLEITRVRYPDSVCRDGSFTAEVTIENQGGFHEVVTVSGSGLGSTHIGKSFSLREGETKTVKQVFTNVKGSGSEEFKITATNHDTDRVWRDINVDDCGYTIPDGDVSAETISMEVSPKETVIGNPVRVTGFVDGIRGRTTVEVYVGGDRKARVSTQPDGYYQVYVRPDKVGEQQIEVRAAGRSAFRTINVLPTSSVGGLEAPEKVFAGEKFEICTSIDSQITPKVFLERDGKILESRYAKGDVCFEETADKTGTHKYSITSMTYGITKTSFTTVEVMESKPEVTSFPDKVATVETEDGMVKVELYNTHKDLKRYHVSLEGLPETWTAQTEKEVILKTGEPRTVYFYITPRDSGRYDPVVVVDSDGSTVFRQDIVLESGGTKTPARKSLTETILSFFGF